MKLIKLDLNSEHIVTQGLALWLSEHIVILSGSLIDQISELDEEKRIYIKQKMLEILETLLFLERTGVSTDASVGESA